QSTAPPRDPLSFPTRRSSDLDAVAQRLRLLHRPARDADDLVVDGPETLDADQQVADAGLLELDALLAPGERDRVGDERPAQAGRSEEHTSELQSLTNLVCRLL